MAKKPAVICLYCNQTFQREEEEFVQEGRRYAHKNCAEEVEKLQTFLAEKMGEYYSPTKIKNQINKTTKEGYSLEDICNTMYWWYEVQKGDPSKSNGGIGIFSYVYPDYIKYKNNQDKKANINRNKILDDYIDNVPLEITVKPTPIKKPRIKLFNFE